MGPQPPWTQIGSLQQDIESIKRDLYGKVDDHEFRSVKSDIARVERELTDFRTQIDILLARVSALEELNPIQ